MCRLFASGGQSVGASASASVLPMNIQGWFCLGLTGLISLQSKELSRVFSCTRIEKHQFLGPRLLYGPTLISKRDYWKNHSFNYVDLCWQWSLFVWHGCGGHYAFIPLNLFIYSKWLVLQGHTLILWAGPVFEGLFGSFFLFNPRVALFHFSS